MEEQAAYNVKSGWPVTIISASNFSPRFDELWRYRDLLRFLVWKDIKVRYAQTLMGVVWVVFQPLLSVGMYCLLFTRVIKLPQADIPYPVFVLSGVIIWNFFSSALNKCSTSLVSNANLLTKIYFPRIIIPISAVLSGVLDLAVSFIILIAFMVYYQVATWQGLLLVPLMMLLACLTALAFGLWLSALNVRYRDISYVVPFILQIWMFATPVFYASSLIPSQIRQVFWLNPAATIVEGFRRSLFQNYSLGPDQMSSMAASVALVVVLLVSGLWYFRQCEKEFADIV